MGHGPSYQICFIDPSVEELNHFFRRRWPTVWILLQHMANETCQPLTEKPVALHTHQWGWVIVDVHHHN